MGLAVGGGGFHGGRGGGPGFPGAGSGGRGAGGAGSTGSAGNYLCNRCGRTGHSMKYCPTLGDPRFDPEMRLMNIPKAGRKKVASLEGIDTAHKTVSCFSNSNLAKACIV